MYIRFKTLESELRSRWHDKAARQNRRIRQEDEPMDKLFNISDRTNAALHALALIHLSHDPLPVFRAAEKLKVSPTYLAKTLQPLVEAGILHSTRGANGGFRLLRDGNGISCLEIMELLDGPLDSRDCLFPKAVCASGTCVLSAVCRDAGARVLEAFRTTTIAGLAGSFAPGSLHQTEQ